MKVGMIGIGDIAKKAYLPVLTEIAGVELYVCTRNEATLSEIEAKYKLHHLYSNMEEWMESGIEAAFVHSSTESHESIIDQLLDRGIHVYVDKPITYDGASSRRLLEKAEEKNLILMAGFNRRYALPYKKLKEVERPNMIVMQKNRGHQAGDARTFVFDDFIHVIDTLLTLFPYAIEDVRIRGHQQDGKLHHVVLQLEAAEGTAIGIMNREAGTTEEKVEVMSEGETRTVLNVNETRSHADKNILLYGSDDWEPTLKKRGFYDVVAAFLEAVQTGERGQNVKEQDLQTHLLAEKIVQSIEIK